MQEVLTFALLGLATGGIYALLAQGLVLVYRGSGLLNFSQGAIAMFGAYLYYEVTSPLGLPLMVGLVVAVAASAALGALMYLAALRRMRDSSPLTRVIATLGFVLILQSAAYLIFGQYALPVKEVFPTDTVSIGSLTIGLDRILIIVVCVVVAGALRLVYVVSPFGRVTTAVAENELAASSFGYSPARIAAINWAVGGGLAGLAGVLIAPIIFLSPDPLVLLIVPAMTAALVGGFSSFGVTLTAAFVLGIAQSEIGRYISAAGWSTAAPFIAIIVVLAVRGRALPVRGFIFDRLPAVGTGRIRPIPAVLATAVAVFVVSNASAEWQTAVVTTLGGALVCLSVVLLTGYAGQLSLAQYVLGGVGALLAARLALHASFVVSFIVGTLGTGAVGAAIGLPALRTRGMSLAVATLGLSAALVAVVLENSSYTGGVEGIDVKPPTLFGWSIDPLLHPGRYADFAIVLFALACVVVANVRRGVTGRRLLAVRSNERAAAALGVNVAVSKLYAFMVAAVIAAAGGIVIAFAQPSVDVGNFDVFTCIVVVAVTITAGVGNILGALLGSLLIAGGVVTTLFSGLSAANDYLPLIGGCLLVVTVSVSPDGLVEVNRRMLAVAVRPLVRCVAGNMRFGHFGQLGARGRLDRPEAPQRVSPRALSVENVTVAFGGVKALDSVTLEVAPGTVHGLIGPNGAGKTTLIDAITGFVTCKPGSTISLGATNVANWSARRRARFGLARSFQTLELFNDLTVEENLAIAEDHSGYGRLVSDLVIPRRVKLGAASREALHQFGLTDLLDARPSEVSFGQRKLIAISRAIAAAPSALLLDEPAAGLDDKEAEALVGVIRYLADVWGMAILLVEHNLNVVMGASDELSVLNQGRLLASGLPEEIRRDQDVIDAYLGVS